MLIGEYVVIFPPSDRRPHFQGRECAVPSELMVPNHSAAEPVVGGRDPIVVVEVELGKSGDIDQVFLFSRYLWGKIGVEAVNPLHEQDIAFSEAKLFPLLFRFSRFEIEDGNLDFPSSKKCEKMTVKLLDVESTETFEIEIAIGIQRNIFSGAKVIVKADNDGIKAKYLKLYRQFFVKVVFPDEEGPAMSTTRTVSRLCAIWSAIWLIFLS